MKRITPVLLGIILFAAGFVAARLWLHAPSVAGWLGSFFSAPRAGDEAPVSAGTPAAQGRINEYHPVVFVVKAQDGTLTQAIVLGGYARNIWYKVSDFPMMQGGKVVKADDYLLHEELNGRPVTTNLVKGQERFKLYNAKTQLGTATGGPPAFAVDGFGHAALSLRLTPAPAAAGQDFCLGINGDWDALPRLAKELPDKKTFQIDLDGDGKDEYLLVEPYIRKEDGLTGMRVMVKRDKDKPDKDGLPVEQVKMDGAYVNVCQVLTLDLNGDGRLEIVIYTSGVTIGVNVYEIGAEKVAKVLQLY